MALAIVVLGLLVFGRLLMADFVRWDDLDMVVGNALLRPPEWSAFWKHATLGLYTPLSYSLLAMVTAFSWMASNALEPVWFHATNIFLHCIAAFAVWRLLLTLLKDPKSSAIGTAVFLLHPLAVEPVAWISSVNTVLAATLAIIALNLAVAAHSSASHGRRGTYFAGSCGCVALALLAKPTVCALPIALLAIDRMMLHISYRIAFSRAAAWLAVSIPFVIVGRHVQPAPTIVAPDWPSRLVGALDSIGFYVIQWVVPIRLGIDYGRTPDQVGANVATAIHLVASIGLLSIAIVQFRKRPVLSAGSLIALAGLAPVLGFVPFDFQYYSTVADRYAYFSTLGPALIVAGLLARGNFQQRAVVVSVAALTLFAGLTFVQAGTWNDTNALMRQALRINPDSVAAYETLGFMNAQEASDVSRSPTERGVAAGRAYAFYNRALTLRPGSARTHYNLANLLFKAGRPADALQHYSIAATTLANDVRLQNNWGIACWQLGDASGAIRHFDRAIDIDARHSESYANKALVLLRSGQRDAARSLCAEALKLDARQPQAQRIMRELDAK